jgi:hypothetical protein
MSEQYDIAALLELGNSAREYMALRDEVKALKQEYKEERDRFMLAFPGREWADYIEDPAFQLCTRKSHIALQKARRSLYNAERRMERRFRRLIAGVAA